LIREDLIILKSNVSFTDILNVHIQTQPFYTISFFTHK